MSMPRNEIGSEMEMAWGVFAQSLEKSIRQLDADINEAKHMASKCTDEWCAATEHVIDDLNNALFSISEPRWSESAVTKKIKELKHRVHDLYADYRQVYHSVH
jgi:hypothetical protein